MSAEQYGGPHETSEERERKIHSLNVRMCDLLDTSKPWLLVKHGSLLGYFDWVSVPCLDYSHVNEQSS